MQVSASFAAFSPSVAPLFTSYSPKSFAARVIDQTGFGGASVLEVVEDYDRETYRAVYTVRLAEAVYVLHCFKKKSKKGIETPKHDLELIKARLKRAEEHYRLW